MVTQSGLYSGITLWWSPWLSTQLPCLFLLILCFFSSCLHETCKQVRKANILARNWPIQSTTDSQGVKSHNQGKVHISPQQYTGESPWFCGKSTARRQIIRTKDLHKTMMESGLPAIFHVLLHPWEKINIHRSEGVAPPPWLTFTCFCADSELEAKSSYFQQMHRHVQHSSFCSYTILIAVFMCPLLATSRVGSLERFHECSLSGARGNVARSS